MYTENEEKKIENKILNNNFNKKRTLNCFQQFSN